MDNPRLKLYDDLKRLDARGRKLTSKIKFAEDGNMADLYQFLCQKADVNKSISEIYEKLKGGSAHG
jgi:hypothetical protein